MTRQETLLSKGIIDRIGIKGGVLKQCVNGISKTLVEKDIPDHTVGLKLVFDSLIDGEFAVIDSLAQIDSVGHRVVHGGELFKEAVLVNSEVKQQIADCSELAPLHNPANLKGIMSVEALLPGVPQVAVFDTAFHQDMPEYSYLYGIPYQYYEKYKIRRYGFHGISHKYVAEQAAKLCARPLNTSKVITCHLGNGASVCGIKNGVSVDTSMGFTPVTGLMMGTRCGTLDPGILLYLEEKEHLSIKGISHLINKESGLQGISGLSSDMRDIEQAALDGIHRAKLAFDMYVYRVRKWIGSFVGVLNGIDLLVFTGGVGENSFKIRESVCKHLTFFGIKLDEHLNVGMCGQSGIISASDSSVSVAVINTNEELVIARETYAILNNN